VDVPRRALLHRRVLVPAAKAAARPGPAPRAGPSAMTSRIRAARPLSWPLDRAAQHRPQRAARAAGCL